MIEHFRPRLSCFALYDPLLFFRPLAHQNRPQGYDSDHFENHWVRQ